MSGPAAPAASSCDVAIVGGGMVGASLALALAALPLDVVVIEAIEPEDGSQPSFDSRTIALSNGTRRIFSGLGVWDEIAREATPIRKIHISDRGRFGSALVDAADQGVAAIGYVAENRVIGRALWRRLRGASRTRLEAPCRVTAVQPGDASTAREARARSRRDSSWPPMAPHRSCARRSAWVPRAGTTGRPPSSAS